MAATEDGARGGGGGAIRKTSVAGGAGSKAAGTGIASDSANVAHSGQTTARDPRWLGTGLSPT
jgi:hypothetical protein